MRVDTSVQAVACAAPEVEAQLIAAVGADPALYWDVLKALPPDSRDAFTMHRDAWDRLARRIEADEPIFLPDDGVFPTADPVAAAKHLSDLSERRRIASVLEDAGRGFRAGERTTEIVRRIAQSLTSLHPSKADEPDGAITWGDTLVDPVLEHALAASDLRQSGSMTVGLPTGHTALDRALNGLQGGRLYALGGAPGVGKTTLALQWACHVADHAETPVLFVSFESDPRSLATKVLCRLAGIPTSSIERGRIEPERLLAAIDLYGRIGPRLAFVNGGGRTTTAFLLAQAIAAMSRHHASRCLIVVDYLQRMAYRERYQRLVENVSALTQEMREMAGRLDSPVLAISALTRNGADVDMPTLEALKEAGDLEYAADAVLLLGSRRQATLASTARARAQTSVRLLDLLIAKNRFGDANVRLPMVFDAAIGSFSEESA